MKIKLTILDAAAYIVLAFIATAITILTFASCNNMQPFEIRMTVDNNQLETICQLN